MRAPSSDKTAVEVMAHVRGAHAESKAKGFEGPYLALMDFLHGKIMDMLFKEVLMPLVGECKRIGLFSSMRSDFIRDFGYIYRGMEQHGLEYQLDPNNDHIVKQRGLERPGSELYQLRQLYLHRGSIWHGMLTFLAEQNPAMLKPNFNKRMTRTAWQDTDVGALRLRLGLGKDDKFIDDEAVELI
jgi:hypothetical protein